MERSEILGRRECVGAFIVVNEKFLLCKRRAEFDFYPNVWDTLGGHRKENESLEDVLRRELSEELGITPTTWEFLYSAAELDEAVNGAGLYYFYLVTAFDGDPQNLQHEEHVHIE